MTLYRCSKRACGHLWRAGQRPDVCPACGGRRFREIRLDDLPIDEIVELSNQCDESTEEGLAVQAELFRLAAMAGDLWGITNLGWCCEVGAGVEKDEKQAVWLYTQAAEAG